jgi:hypothetical protein
MGEALDEGHNGDVVRSIVPLPPDVRSPFQVYVNGVRQEAGVDYQLRNSALVFERELKKEGKLGFWRWFLGAWGVGTYRQNDSVDVSFERNGRPALIEGLDIEAAPGP